MRAVQRWVYREASTNPSSAFSPSFLEAIAYHILPALFLKARIKVEFTTQLPNTLLPTSKMKTEVAIGLSPTKSQDMCEKPNSFSVYKA